MKSIRYYISSVRELIRERARIFSEYDRAELDYDEDLKRHQSKQRGRKPTAAKRRGVERSEWD